MKETINPIKVLGLLASVVTFGTCQHAIGRISASVELGSDPMYWVFLAVGAAATYCIFNIAESGLRTK